MDIPCRLSGGNNWYTCQGPESSSYESMKLHEEMMRDRFFKTLCQDVILKNKHVFQDKVVLDVDCGTGILALFIASQGAKTVIGIESSFLAERARENVATNNMGNVVQIIQGNVNEIESLPDGIESVDIIVSQWMGFLLFDKLLLTSLTRARDRWLKPEGLMYPDSIRLLITGVEYSNKTKEIYDLLKFENFDMTCLKTMEFELPRVEIVPAGRVVTSSGILRIVNLKTIRPENFCFSEYFELIGSHASAVNAFVLFFEVCFTKCHKHVYISSSPHDLPSRWKQLVLCFENRLIVKPNESIKGSFALKESQAGCTLFFNLNIQLSGASCKTKFSVNYRL